jgi:hypothetical protein
MRAENEDAVMSANAKILMEEDEKLQAKIESNVENGWAKKRRTRNEKRGKFTSAELVGGDGETRFAKKRREDEEANNSDNEEALLAAYGYDPDNIDYTNFNAASDEDGEVEVEEEDGSDAEERAEINHRVSRLERKKILREFGQQQLRITTMEEDQHSQQMLSLVKKTNVSSQGPKASSQNFSFNIGKICIIVIYSMGS